VTHGIDASMDPMKTTGSNAVVNRIFSKAQLEELPPPNDPVLPSRQLCDPFTRPTSLR
jgi:hypothetical protein